jgi:hypothetical protein
MSLFFLRRLPDKNSQCDPMPVLLLKATSDLLIPFLSELFNRSLSSGSFPSSWKKACISPVLKKGKTDTQSLSSYRPVSKLPTLAKLLEKIVASQLQRYINDHNLLPSLQSAYRPFHSCESAVLKVVSDSLLSLDKGDVCLLSFLDMTSAFDCVDHVILAERLRLSFGLCDAPLRWFESFLDNRMISVSHFSSTRFVPLTSGVPQGSVLGPLLFSLYISDIIALVHRHNLNVHLYADDVLIYGSSSPNCSSTLCSRVSACLEQVKLWLNANRLCLNSEKTKLMWCQSPRRRPVISSPVLFSNRDLHPVDSVTYLGVTLDSHLSFSANVTRTSNACFSMLRRIRSIRRSLTRPLLVSVITSLVLSRLDYCLSLHVGLPSSTLWRLQRVLHASARLVYGASSFDRVTPLLRDLGWLSVKQRIDFRLGTFAFLCRKGLAPSYLSEELIAATSVPGRYHLRSASSGHFIVPRVRRPTLGGRSFSVSAAQIWNHLPIDIISACSVSAFKSCFKKSLL